MLKARRYVRGLHPARRALCSTITKATVFRSSRGVISSQQKTMASPKLTMADRLKGHDENMWVKFTKLVIEEKALNLGQGFPDFMPPEYVSEALTSVASKDDFRMYQYARSYGSPRLVKALAKLYSPLIGHDINPLDDVLIGCGAYLCLYNTFQGYVNPGDEVIIIEPCFDCYASMVTIAGGTPVFVPLRPSGEGASSSADWKLDPEELASKFSEKTKILVFNNPNNPLGKVYTRAEMELVADLCKKHDVLCLSDEVYEWIVYKPNSCIRMASLPGMWDRTITIGSAGKTFSVTGWKLGWAIAPLRILRPLQVVHQNSVYCCATPTQEAAAIAFEHELERLDDASCYFNTVSEELIPKRDRMAKMLRDIGMTPIIPEGGYLMLADTSKIDFPYDAKSNETKDAQFVIWMTKVKKIAAIPPSAFYGPEHKELAANLVRFCFMKTNNTLDMAEEQFSKWKTI